MNTRPPGRPGLVGDAFARLELFSDEDGMTYRAGAQAPSGAVGDGRPVGGHVEFTQHQRWRKKAANATLKYVITELRLDLIDGNLQSLTFADGPRGDSFTVNDCRDTVYARVLPNFTARADRDPTTPADGLEVPMGRDDIAQLNGWVGHWEPLVDEEGRGAWSVGDIRITDDHDANGSKRHAHVKLIKPLMLEVPLGRLPTGADILVDTELTVEAMNNRRCESYAGAWFRDPARSGGAGFVVSGLEPVPPVAVPPPDPPPDPSPACPGPAAGAIAFESADFFSAELRTRDGSATAGSDDVATAQRGWFRDGQMRRVLHLPLLPDGVAEPNETVGLEIADPRGCAELGTQRTATLTIRDDDRPAPTPAATFSVGGTVSGLAGSGLVLRHQARAVSLPVVADGRFVFAGSYARGTSYDVQVGTQPSNPTQVCSVTRGRGTVAADVDDIAVGCSSPPPASGLDPTFGGGGRVTAGPAGAARAAALQADGKLRVAGRVGRDRGDESDVGVARINLDGMRDASFGNAGRVIVDLSPNRDEAGALALQPDGRIVLAVARSEVGNFGFGSNGFAFRQIGPGADSPAALVLQADGRIVVAGSALDHAPSYDAVDARFLPDGKLLMAGSAGKGLAVRPLLVRIVP